VVACGLCGLAAVVVTRIDEGFGCLFPILTHLQRAVSYARARWTFFATSKRRCFLVYLLVLQRRTDRAAVSFQVTPHNTQAKLLFCLLFYGLRMVPAVS
jgi:hypothetical protein